MNAKETYKSYFHFKGQAYSNKLGKIFMIFIL
jgi:hypothetical protein